MIIICRGVSEGGKLEKCDFVHDGSWDDEELVLHEKSHRSQECKDCSWLGFDITRGISSPSGRDGKRP
ncbi:MAG: hypothetical protein D9C04_00180 [Nitrosopumilus sp. B06]|nr:MAG: hypothetical protein EB828_01475 [Nitrosopumilus sp. D6]RNJ80733.1 MAG: hypothetical protein D9C04_00180 [Nitrosopumilus sp. B06]